MGFLDSLENEALGKVMGGTSNPMAASVLQMIQSQPGGLQGLVQSFHDKGMGGVVSSWVGNGANASITADEVHQVLGGEQVKALAAKAGVDPNTAGNMIAQMLPTLVNQLTPNGQVPEHENVMSMVGGLLQSFGQQKPA